MRVLVGVLALVLLTSGCTTVTHLPPAATNADVEKFLARELDSQWMQVGLPASQRPTPARIRFISNAEWGAVMGPCTDEARNQYLVVVGEPFASALALYRCQAEYPTDPSEYAVLSVAQIQYLYDYYVRWTVPCLELHDHTVSDVPSRAEFLQLNGYWNPMYTVNTAGHTSDAEYNRLNASCGTDVIARFPRATNQDDGG